MKPNQTYPTDLTDAQWHCIKDLIPPAKPGGRPRSLQMRAVINAILYVVVTGCQWRMLPKEYPAWQSVYTYFRAFRKNGTWQRIHETLRSQVRRRAGRHKHPTASALDSQSVKTTQGPGICGYDAGKQVKGRKRHILVDTLGLLMAVVVTMAASQKQKTPSMGSVTGLLNEPLPGLFGIGVWFATMRGSHQAVRPSSSWLLSIACLSDLLLSFPFDGNQTHSKSDIDQVGGTSLG